MNYEKNSEIGPVPGTAQMGNLGLTKKSSRTLVAARVADVTIVAVMNRDHLHVRGKRETSVILWRRDR